MNITLQKLALDRFKGVQAFALDPEGDSLTVRGDNRTGKTTLVDAWAWLLFGKDSEGRADFGIKGVDEQSGPKNNIEHAVEGVLEIDGKIAALKKVYKEKWTKKRGEARPSLTGNTTNYYIDEVPIKKKDWDDRISQIIDEDTFRLLTDPHFFNNLHWQRRREILLSVCGDVSDDEVINSNIALQGLREILNGHGIEDVRKRAQSAKRKINEKLSEIPTRIDELDKSMAEVPAIDLDVVQANIDRLTAEIDAAKNDTARAELTKKKLTLEAEFLRLEQAQGNEWREGMQPLRDAIADLEKEVNGLNDRAARINSDIQNWRYDIERNQDRMESLRKTWHNANEERPDIKDTCLTCGQTLPEGQIKAAQEKYNSNKASLLEQINAEGKALKEKIDELQSKVRGSEEALASIKAEREPLQKQLTETKGDLAAAEQKITTLEPTDDMVAIKTEIEGINAQLEAQKPIDTHELEKARADLQTQIADVAAAKRAKTRIEDLEIEERALAKEFEEIERRLALLDQFTVSKVEMLEDKIAAKFELVRFKMFDVQINEGIRETCLTTLNGVPYPDMSNSEKIRAGMDIIKTLQRHYDVFAPLWIDNAESITDLPDMVCQVIRLVVDESARELTIDKSTNDKRRAVNE